MCPDAAAEKRHDGTQCSGFDGYRESRAWSPYSDPVTPASRLGRTIKWVLTLFMASSLSTSAAAVTLTLQSEHTPWPGVTWKHYKSASPKGNVRVAFVDLCATGVQVNSRKTPSSTASAGSFAQSVGAQLATNGDFYKTGPVRVYGRAVADGVPWPSIQTGVDAAYSWEWFYKKHGWIALLHDGVQFQHSKWVKNNWPAGVSTGWKPGNVVTTIPPGTIALVSGFSQLVIEGMPVTCASPTAADCFPDRSDMMARHPRTAMGLTEDMQTFILAVVDGRTSANLGMYGAELADLMHQMGAWVAFNLDGGGSSQMWVSGQGYVNDYSGNNYGNGARSMANHWAVFAGANGQPDRPGSCVDIDPCGVIAPGGGIVDNEDPCFVTFGPEQYWRTESVGYAGSLRWTNAFQASQPSNWAWWRLHFQEAGTYLVEYRNHAQFGVYADTEYSIRHKGGATTVTVDQSAGSGWVELTEVEFKKNGAQWVAVYDNAPDSVAADQHIVADAVRLTRIGPWCGNGACDGDETCASCEADCGACPFCGDGTCDADEDCSTCESDCGPCEWCGDGTCYADEDCSTCESDCGPCEWCGDGTCQADEDCASCEADCGPCLFCGDATCSPPEGCDTCPADCGECSVCGDGQCAADEDCDVCAVDCAPCRGEHRGGEHRPPPEPDVVDDLADVGDLLGDTPAGPALDVAPVEDSPGTASDTGPGPARVADTSSAAPAGQPDAGGFTSGPTVIPTSDDASGESAGGCGAGTGSGWPLTTALLALWLLGAVVSRRT